MNVADFVILGTLSLSVILAFFRGFVVEAMSIVNWIAAFVIARLFSGALALLLTDWVDPPSAREPLAFILLFILTLLVGALVKNLLKNMIKATGLSSMDRMLGSLFGLFRGVLLVVVALSVLSRLTQASTDPWWQRSVLIPHFMVIETWTLETGMALRQKIMGIRAQ